jgi:hypothetical protein
MTSNKLLVIFFEINTQKSMKKLIIYLSTMLITLCGQAQKSQKVEIQANYRCNYFGYKVNEKAICNMYNGFVSKKDAEYAVDQIVKRSGLKRNFHVMECPQIDNCFAATQNGIRLIVYDAAFMKKVNDRTKTDWGGMSILAHEIGHHLQGHTIDGEASDPAKELEADYFSGFVMYQLGAPLKEAQAAINKFQDDYGSSTHPPRRNRIAMIEKGYNEAKALYPNITPSTPKSTIPTETEKEPEVIVNKPAPRPQKTPIPTPRKQEKVELEEIEPDEVKENGEVVYETKKNTNSGDNKTGCIEGDCLTGFGIAINAKTKERYEGIWYEGKRHGKGSEYLASGKIKYEGDYDKGRWNGNGALYLPNGDRYVGRFKDNVINESEQGYSYYQYKNGDKYIGQFKNGKKHGKGKWVSKDGKRENVIFENDVRVK